MLDDGEQIGASVGFGSKHNHFGGLDHLALTGRAYWKEEPVLDYPNLWNIPPVSTPLDATDNIQEILRVQTQYLKSGTDGKVLAKFCRIADVSADFTDESSAMLRTKTDSADMEDLPDANALYKHQRYGFEIYTSSYKFRIFEMNLTPLYPVSLFLDEDIQEEAKAELRHCCIKRGTRENEYVIQSDGELVKCLKAVLSSKKVTYIIYRLQQT